ncbi:MAG: DoxX family protein, partial [Cyanobacteria bacterium J06631_6]
PKVQEERQYQQSSAVNHYISFLARIFLSSIFLWSGTNKIIDPLASLAKMTAQGMPFTSVLLVGAIALEILGGLSVLLGIKPRWGAVMLVIFLVPATLIFHTDFSTELEQAMFLKNLAMLGGLLLLIQNGGGNIVLWSENRLFSASKAPEGELESDQISMDN